MQTAETQASWEDRGYFIDFPFRNNMMLKRQLEKYLRSLPAVSHKPTTLGHSSQTTRILWGQRWLVSSLNFVLWNSLNSFAQFRGIKSRSYSNNCSCSIHKNWTTAQNKMSKKAKVVTYRWMTFLLPVSLCFTWTHTALGLLCRRTNNSLYVYL